MAKTKELELIDLYLSAFLTLHGQEPKLINKNGKVLFCFNATDKVYQLMTLFNSNTETPCLDLITSIKTLRGKMLTFKESGFQGNGNGVRYEKNMHS